jgi:hypothetical protein
VRFFQSVGVEVMPVSNWNEIEVDCTAGEN